MRAVMPKVASSFLALLALLCALVPEVRAGAAPAPLFTVIASGLNNPRGLAVAPDGAVYVAEAGAGGAGPCVKGQGGPSCLGPTGAVTRIQNGSQARVLVGLPSVAGKDGTQATGPSDVYVASDGTVYVSMQGVDSTAPAAMGTADATL